VIASHPQVQLGAALTRDGRLRPIIIRSASRCCAEGQEFGYTIGLNGTSRANRGSSIASGVSVYIANGFGGRWHSSCPAVIASSAQ